jgi:hypothetical protein
MTEIHRILLAGAGAGKTTYLVKKVLESHIGNAIKLTVLLLFDCSIWYHFTTVWLLNQHLFA